MIFNAIIIAFPLWMLADGSFIRGSQDRSNACGASAFVAFLPATPREQQRMNSSPCRCLMRPS